jgi:hypothetical protein
MSINNTQALFEHINWRLSQQERIDPPTSYLSAAAAALVRLKLNSSSTVVIKSLASSITIKDHASPFT